MDRLRRLLGGPPWALPPTLDRLAERWAAAPPRVRMALAAVAVLAVVVPAGRGATRSPWGAPQPTVVAARALPAGTVLDARDGTVVVWPAGLRPPDALTRPEVLVGATLTADVAAGQPLRAAWLADGWADALPAGWVALPVEGLPPLPERQVLDLVGSLDGGGITLTRGAWVLGSDGERTWLAVRRDDAPAVAAAAAFGGLTVALLPPDTAG